MENVTLNIMNSREETFPEPHVYSHVSRLNWLRASVLGANDGIVSIAGLVLGVAGATTSSIVILTAGVAGTIAGAISMAAGEYVSVSSSRDLEKALIDRERKELKESPEKELEELATLYQAKGLTKETAHLVAGELTARDPFAAHVDIELGIDPNNLTNPWHAAFASCISFLVGAVIPLIAIILPPENVRIPVAFTAILVALIIAGFLSGKVSGANITRATIRIVIGGALAMAVTYEVGKLFGVAGI